MRSNGLTGSNYGAHVAQPRDSARLPRDRWNSTGVRKRVTLQSQCHDEKGLGIGFDSASQPFGRPSTATLSSTTPYILSTIYSRRDKNLAWVTKANEIHRDMDQLRGVLWCVLSRTPVRDGRVGETERRRR